MPEVSYGIILNCPVQEQNIITWRQDLSFPCSKGKASYLVEFEGQCENFIFQQNVLTSLPTHKQRSDTHAIWVMSRSRN